MDDNGVGTNSSDWPFSFWTSNSVSELSLSKLYERNKKEAFMTISVAELHRGSTPMLRLHQTQKHTFKPPAYVLGHHMSLRKSLCQAIRNVQPLTALKVKSVEL